METVKDFSEGFDMKTSCDLKCIFFLLFINGHSNLLHNSCICFLIDVEVTHPVSSCCPYTVKKQNQFDHIRLILLDRFSSCFSCQNNCCVHTVTDFDIPLSD